MRVVAAWDVARTVEGHICNSTGVVQSIAYLHYLLFPQLLLLLLLKVLGF